MDGYIKVGTKIDESGIDKGIKDLENKIDIAEQKKILIEADIETNKEQLSETTNQLNKLKAKAEELKSTFAGVEVTGKMTPAQFINMQNYNAIIPEIEKIEKTHDKINNSLAKQKVKLQQINGQITSYKSKIEKINLKNQEEQMSQIEKSVTSTISKIGKWTMALVGVRSAYSFLRSMASNVSQYNKQISTDLQYMGFAISKIFEPLIEFIINGLYKILSLINQISIVFFGINLFKDAGTKQFTKAFASAEKSSEKIKNNLASFDELNVLSSDISEGAGGGIETPSFDLSQIQGETPEWLEWIKDNFGEILAIIGAVVGAIIALEAGLGGIKALGIGVVIYGIIMLIKDLLDYLNDPSWENFGNIITDIGLILLGFGLIFGNLPLIIAGTIVSILGVLASNWENIHAFFINIQDTIDNIVENITNFFINALNNSKGFLKVIVGAMAVIVLTVVNTIAGIIKGLFSMIDDLLNGLFIGTKQILDGIILIFKGDFKSGIEMAIKGIGNVIIGVLNFLIDALNTVISPIRSLIVAVGQVTGQNWTMENIAIPRIPALAKGGIISKPTTALIGEAGKEAVIPLENNTEWIDMLEERLERVMSNWKVEAKGSGTWGQFMRFMNLELTKEKNRKGSNFIGGTYNG